jgi:anti-sigma regulatory factor (Ser/Thr protein kinase)
MILADVGPGIPDVELAMQAGYSTAPDEVRSLGFGAGMGLPNMKKYSDVLEVDTTLGVGTTVRMVVKIV